MARPLLQLFSLAMPLKRGIVSAVVCMSLILCSASVTAELTDEQKRKFEEVKRNIEKIKAELEKTKGSRDQLQETLEGNEKNIQELNDKTHKLKQSLDKKQSHLNSLRNEQQLLGKKKSEQLHLVEDYINAAYRLGQHSQVRLLLNQQEPAQISRMLKYYEAFSESRAEKIAEFLATLERLNQIEPEIASETEKLQTTYRALKDQQASLKASQQNRRQTLAKLENEFKSQSQRLAGLNTDRRRLEKLLSDVYDEINAQELNFAVSDFRKLKGKLPWPTKGKSKVRFGQNRGSTQLKWQGLVINANRGADVVAIHHGQVVFSDYLRGHGLLLSLIHI